MGVEMIDKKTLISLLRYVSIISITASISVFFWAWVEYAKHAKPMLLSENYYMPWDVLYLNLYWLVPVVLGAVFLKSTVGSSCSDESGVE
jgi:hypothetical protein